METKAFSTRIPFALSIVAFVAAALCAAPAMAGTALYSSPSDAVKIDHPKISYSASGITITADFMASVDLPAESGSLVGGPGDFTYTWHLVSVSPQPASNSMFCGPMLSINGNRYAWLYGSKNGVLSMRATGGHSNNSKGILLDEKAYGDSVEVTQMPSSIRIRRAGSMLYFEYTYSDSMPFQTGDSVDLGPDAGSPVTYQIMWSSVDSVLSAVEVTGPMVPDVDQSGGGGSGGDDGGGGDGGDAPQGFGVAQYTDERDRVKITEPGVTYDGGEIVISGSPYFTLPRQGGFLEDIPPGDFTYTLYMSYVNLPTYPMRFAGISAVINGYDYVVIYRASPSGTLQVKASRGLMGGREYGVQDLVSPPRALRIERSGNVLTWSFSDSGIVDDFQPIASVNLADPLGDGTADDSTGTAKFDVLAFLDMRVSHIEVSGNPMYYVNNQYPWGPDAEVPVGGGWGLLITACVLAFAGGYGLRRRCRPREG